MLNIILKGFLYLSDAGGGGSVFVHQGFSDSEYLLELNVVAKL